MDGFDPAKHLQTYGITHEEMQKQYTDLNARILTQHQAAQEKKKNKKPKTPKASGPNVPKESTVGPLSLTPIVPTVRRRNHEELYEEHNDKRLMDQKVLADSRKINHEKTAHKNIINQEHLAHQNRVIKLCVNERKHISQIYDKQMSNLVRQKDDMTEGQFHRLEKQIETQYEEMNTQVSLHGMQLNTKFIGQEHLHSNLFGKIENVSATANKCKNNLTGGYNEAKKASYQDQFLFGIKHEYPEANVCLKGDCSSTHGDDYKFLNYSTHYKPLLQNYRHTST